LYYSSFAKFLGTKQGSQVKTQEENFFPPRFKQALRLKCPENRNGNHDVPKRQARHRQWKFAQNTPRICKKQAVFSSLYSNTFFNNKDSRSE